MKLQRQKEEPKKLHYNDHLATLGFTNDEEPNIIHIKKRWRKLCKKYHPDIGTGDKKKFLEITHAFRMLTDPAYKNQGRISCKDLTVYIRERITFWQAFNGCTMKYNYNVITVDDKFETIPQDPLEIEILKIEIKPGSFEDMEFLFGNKGFRYKAIRGDIYYTLKVDEHPRFKAKCVSPSSKVYDIYTTELIPLKIMIKGGKINVKTVHGDREYIVPSGTQPNDCLIIKKLGCNGGDHVIIVQPVYPTKQNVKKEFKELEFDTDDTTEEDLVKYIKDFDELKEQL